MSHLPARFFPGQNQARPVRTCRATTRAYPTCIDAADSAASHETYQMSRVRCANQSSSRQLSGLWSSGCTFSHANRSRHQTARRSHFQFGFGYIIFDLFCFLTAATIGFRDPLGTGFPLGVFVLKWWWRFWLWDLIFICFVSCFGVLTAAIILGHKAHNRVRNMPSQYAGGGMAIAAIILGYFSIPISLVMIAVMFFQQAHYQAEMGDSRRKAQIINSESNLKQIGLAFRIWEGDHNDQFPFNVSQTQGGTRELCEPDSNGFEKNPVPIFMVMSNELGTTRILVCPNDQTKQAAADFASLTANNISYQLRTGTNVNKNNPEEILAIDPINGLVLHCDGSVLPDFHYKKTATNH